MNPKLKRDPARLSPPGKITSCRVPIKEEFREPTPVVISGTQKQEQRGDLHQAPFTIQDTGGRQVNRIATTGDRCTHYRISERESWKPRYNREKESQDAPHCCFHSKQDIVQSPFFFNNLRNAVRRVLPCLLLEFYTQETWVIT